MSEHEMSNTTRRAAEVLIKHTRTSIEACHCGWGRDGTALGKSHAEHVAQALSHAGLLATDEVKAEVAAKAWDEGHKQGGPMHDVNCDDPGAHNRNPYSDRLRRLLDERGED